MFNLKLYNKNTAAEQLDRVAKLQEKYIKEIGNPFVRLSDEFYVTAERDVPTNEFYDSFKQLEDGVGVIRIFRNYIKDSLLDLKKNASGSFTIVTGVSAYNEILKAANIIMEANSKIKINVKKIINNFLEKL